MNELLSLHVKNNFMYFLDCLQVFGPRLKMETSDDQRKTTIDAKYGIQILLKRSFLSGNDVLYSL